MKWLYDVMAYDDEDDEDEDHTQCSALSLHV